jgi:hypothetical protein
LKKRSSYSPNSCIGPTVTTIPIRRSLQSLVEERRY